MMLTANKMKYLVIAGGSAAWLLFVFGAGAQAGAISLSTNGGSYSFGFEETGSTQTGHPRTTKDPSNAFARVPSSGAPGAGTSARAQPNRTAIGANGGTYYFDH
jgi:hypothetical protein